jgi:3-hydroxyisobutyrate dehydrogenase-like beta-hydroxyacid dehydrogenase
MKIGFVGLGKMGTGMAHNLLRAGHKVTVYNRSREKAQRVAEAGAQVAETAAAAAHGAEAVFTMLADDHAVDEVVWGENGLASGLGPDAVHISSSTVSVAFSRKLGEQHAARNQAYVAAPVFGRPDAAEKKMLIVVAAGDAGRLERFRPLFEAIGRRTFIAGDQPWHANAMKLCGNFMIVSMLETFSEAFTTVAKAGLSRQAFLDVMTELWGSPVYKNYGQTIVDRRFDTGDGFGLRLGLKDVRQVVELAQDVAAPMPIASLIRDHLLSAVAHGQESLDWSSLELVLARAAGLPEQSA